MVEITEIPSPEHDMQRLRLRPGGQGAFLSPLKKDGGLVDEIVEAPVGWSPDARSDGSGSDGGFGWGGGLKFKIQDDDDEPPSAPVQNLTAKQGISSASPAGVTRRPPSGASSAATARVGGAK